MPNDPLFRNTFADSINVGHNFAETYIKFGDEVIMMPAATMKELALQLRRAVEDWEAAYGEIKPLTSEPPLSLPKKVLKALYREKKVTGHLTSINTRRKKKR